MGVLSRNFSDVPRGSRSAMGDCGLGTVLLVDCPGGCGSSGCCEGSVSAGPTSVVYWGLDHVHWTGAGRAVMGSIAGIAGCFQPLLRLSDEGRGESVIVRARRRLRQLHETDKTNHTMPHLSENCRVILREC